MRKLQIFLDLSGRDIRSIYIESDIAAESSAKQHKKVCRHLKMHVIFSEFKYVKCKLILHAYG